MRASLHSGGDARAQQLEQRWGRQRQRQRRLHAACTRLAALNLLARMHARMPAADLLPCAACSPDLLELDLDVRHTLLAEHQLVLAKVERVVHLHGSV